MSAGTYNITIEQGATFRRRILWQNSDGEPRDLTGLRTARAMIRPYVGCGTYYAGGSTDFSSVFKQALRDAGYTVIDISVNKLASIIEIAIGADDTANLNFDRGAWDLEVVFNDGSIERVLQGAVYVSKEVSR